MKSLVIIFVDFGLIGQLLNRHLLHIGAKIQEDSATVYQLFIEFKNIILQLYGRFCKILLRSLV